MRTKFKPTDIPAKSVLLIRVIRFKAVIYIWNNKQFETGEAYTVINVSRNRKEDAAVHLCLSWKTVMGDRFLSSTLNTSVDDFYPI